MRSPRGFDHVKNAEGDKNLMKLIITGDGLWVNGYSVARKQQSFPIIRL
jgi:hypothetical protein